MSSEKPSLNTSPRTPRLRPDEFIAKWRDIDFGEKQASQEMFLDICALVDHLTPVAYGDRDAFTFEKWVPGGFADALPGGSISAGSSRGTTQTLKMDFFNCCDTRST